MDQERSWTVHLPLRAWCPTRRAGAGAALCRVAVLLGPVFLSAPSSPVAKAEHALLAVLHPLQEGAHILHAANALHEGGGANRWLDAHREGGQGAQGYG